MKNLSQVSDSILSFFKDELGEMKIGYESSPVQLEGGNETTIFHFKLNGDHPSLSKPLILRKFRKEHEPNHSIQEKIVHNSLVDQGFPVPYVHFTCINNDYLGSQILIMDYMPGDILPMVFGPDTNIVLGKTHAALHNANSIRINEDLIAEGFGGRQHSIEGKLDWLLEECEHLPWLENVVRWLMENRPSECDFPSICHGDFHPGNLLAKDGVVSAILDWSCCQISDPVMDVASTLVVFNAATKHLIPAFDSNIETRKYLDAYKSERDLDKQYLEYYQVLGCAIALFAGTIGVLVWTQPPIQKELIDIIYNFTGIHVEVPG